MSKAYISHVYTYVMDKSEMSNLSKKQTELSQKVSLCMKDLTHVLNELYIVKNRLEKEK